MSELSDYSNAFSEHAAATPPGSPQRSRMSEFADSVELLADLQQAGLADLDQGLEDAITLLGRLADTIQENVNDFDDDNPTVSDRIEFVIAAVAQVRQVVLSDEADAVDQEKIELLRDEVALHLETPVECSQDTAPEAEIAAPSADQIAEMLKQLSENHSKPMESRSEVATDWNSPPESAKKTTSGEVAIPAVDVVELDEEIQEAFLDDAGKGLAAMEQALLDLESEANATEPMHVILRELHTIKGASASIGMENLSGYIHEIEEFIRVRQESGQAISQQELLRYLDVIRCRVEGTELPTGETNLSVGINPSVETPSDEPIDESDQRQPQSGSVVQTVSESATIAPPAFKPATNGTPESLTNPMAPAAPQRTASQSSNSDDETVRVKSSQLNRLMDMLSELVMLRNQRDTELSDLKQIHDELTYSVTRMRMLSHEGEALLAMDKLSDAALAAEGVSFSRLNEVASDVMESARRLHDCYQPVSAGNEAVSQFIRNFRLELTQLRRTPVAGLFRRLHRAISDAARAEDKKVRVELLGEGTGIERSLQERIFEPLLHIVRNSVSHGIETPDARVAKGKTPHGIVTLQAHSGPDLLVIEVRDDGAGLDFDAIRRRGIERGLISSDSSASRAELAQLIFHPGFSTKQVADQLSGRGVGMDVVASTLERMRGWVEVDSETGQGSTIRLSLPLPSMIQHVMVFRSGGQLFALPVQTIRRAGEADARVKAKSINEILQLPTTTCVDDSADQVPGVLELSTNSATVEQDTSGDFVITVDRILGPEEVVVRPLPTLLKPHPLCTGATLSGMGEVVLLLDPRRLAQAAQGSPLVAQPSQPDSTPGRQLGPRVLVVDDSKSARLRVVRALQRYRVTIDQFDDGQAAWEAMANQSYDAVFSDIDMPRMTGLELLESIKQDATLQSTPVVMISSRSSETAGTQAMSLGALAYIQKPLVDQRLDEAIAELAFERNE